MQKTSMVLFICLAAINFAFGQDKMIVDKPYSGSTVYGPFAKDVDSLSELPSVIQFTRLFKESSGSDE